MSNLVDNAKKPGLARILAAIFYDVWLVAALWLLGATADMFLRQALTGNPTEGNHVVLQLYYLLAPLLFFGWFWTHGGQTLGMRSWRIRVITLDGENLSWKHATSRYFAALLSWFSLGLGFLWVLFDRDNSSWHDKLSGTRLIMLEKKNKTTAKD